MTEKILARDFAFELNTGTDALPVLVAIGGIETWSPESDIERTDDADFDSAGWAEHKVAQRGRSVTLEGFYKEDPVTGDTDPGQQALIDLSEAVGYASTKGLTITSPGGNTIAGKVSADVTFGGGGKNDNAAFTAELTFTGQPVYTPSV